MIKTINKITISFKNNEEELKLFNLLNSLSDKSAVIKRIIKGEATLDQFILEPNLIPNIENSAQTDSTEADKQEKPVDDNQKEDSTNKLLVAMQKKLEELEKENQKKIEIFEKENKDLRKAVEKRFELFEIVKDKEDNIKAVPKKQDVLPQDKEEMDAFRASVLDNNEFLDMSFLKDDKK